MPKTYYSNRSLAVYWDGLDEFLADLKAYGATVPNLITQAEYDAAQIVATDAQAAARSLGSTAAHVAPSIHAGSTRRTGFITLGGPAYPMAEGAEFGSYHNLPRRTPKRGVVKGWNQFPDWRGSGPEAGYFVMPTIRRDEQQVLDKLSTVFTQIERTVFNE